MKKDKFQTELDKIKMATKNAMPDTIQRALKNFDAVENFKINNPIKDVIDNTIKGIKIFSDIITELNKVLNPYLLKTIEYGIQANNILEKQMYNQFIYKQSIFKMWEEFEEELKSRNRYFPKSEFISLFKKCSKEVKCYLKKGTSLYRARKIEIDEYPSEVLNIINTATESFNDYDHQKQNKKNVDIWDYIYSIPFDDWKQDYVNKFKLQNIDFWGFNAEKSDAPKKTKVQGRINPVGISYLYTANNFNTAISEIQPTIGQIISIAKIKTLRKLNIFDFNFYGAFKNSELMKKSLPEIKKYLGMSIWNLETFFNTLSELFSRPMLGKTEYYYSTQYLSELIKDLGFDGIKYKSSLRKGGSNIVLFDISKDDKNNPINYEIISSSLYKIENVKVISKHLLPRKENLS